MKKLKGVLCIAMLSTVLVGNAFASGSGGSGGLVGFFTDTISGILAVLADDQCPTRQCTNCRPLNGVDDNGNCRPKDD